jgi:hypothetical protein
MEKQQDTYREKICSGCEKRLGFLSLCELLFLYYGLTVVDIGESPIYLHRSPIIYIGRSDSVTAGPESTIRNRPSETNRNRIL